MRLLRIKFLFEFDHQWFGLSIGGNGEGEIYGFLVGDWELADIVNGGRTPIATGFSDFPHRDFTKLSDEVFAACLDRNVHRDARGVHDFSQYDHVEQRTAF